VPNQESTRLDVVFQGLADPTRRAVLERLGSGPATVSELAKPFAMALPSFLQHLGVLEDCGLVKSNKTGRVRTYQLTPRPMYAVEDWLHKQRTIWNRKLDQLDSYLIGLKEEKR
jgi:DNA-binding transcriptional ArsR family regulator